MNMCVILHVCNINYQDLMTQEFYADIKYTQTES
jgi:hypothetical protein